MDTTPDRLLRINRLLLTSIGLWPYQKRTNKIIWLIFAIFLLGTQGYLQTGGMIAAWCDPPIFIESIAPVLLSLMCLVKFINFLYNADKMKLLLDMLQSDWTTSQDEGELKILCHWANDSRKNTIMYAVIVYGSICLFMMGPLVPLAIKIIPDNLLPVSANLSMNKPLLYHVEYLLDMDKYYFPAVINSYFGTLTYVTVVVAIDSMFMVYVQHACAVFEIIGYRLEHLVNTDEIIININPNIELDKPYRRIIECIIKHNRILEYTQLIESANSVSFLFQLCLNMVSISFTGFQAATHLNRIDEVTRYASFVVTQTFHLFYESWPSQRLADESARICEYTTKSMWYAISLRSRKLLQLFIMRSLKPCQLTAGSFYILNLENFTSVVKRSVSYFTVLCSTHQSIE